MKKSSAQITYDDFYAHISWDWYLLDKIEGARAVVKAVEEKRSVFEAYVFHVCADWEILIQDWLVDLLNKDTSMYKEYTGFDVSKHISKGTCKAIILGTGYFDFKNVGDLKSKARKILVPNCNPFEAITNINARKIDDFYTLRNYLAHYSDYAERQLDKMYRNRYGLRTFRQPGEFLLTIDRKQQLTRMDMFIINFLETADAMAKSIGLVV